MPISSAGRQLRLVGNEQRPNWSNGRSTSRRDNQPIVSKPKHLSSFGDHRKRKTEEDKRQVSTRNNVTPQQSTTVQERELIFKEEEEDPIDDTISDADFKLTKDDKMQSSTPIRIGGQVIETGIKQSQGFQSKPSLNMDIKQQDQKGYLSNNNQTFQSMLKNSKSRTSLMSQSQSATTNNSTNHLNSLSELIAASNSMSNNNRSSHPLSIKRNMNLKYIKTLIVALMAVDLLITVFVHQFSTQDQISIWFTSYKLRFSLLNLILSSIWFIMLAGAILFDILWILMIGCLVDICSVILLLVLSIVHFTQRIDYNSVNLTSLLALLFGIVVLHVYMIVLTTLTIYLMLAVKRRQINGSRQSK